MKRIAPVVLAVLFSTAIFAGETQRYLVGTKRPFAAGAVAEIRRNALSEGSAVIGLESFQGFAADLTATEAAALKRSGAVRWIEPVVERRAMAIRNATGQTIPYGIDLVGARQAGAARGIRGIVNVVVADTGIDYRHPELQAIYAGGRNTFTNTDDPMDDNGHGTHVAGTIAAADNSSGVVGVAPQVKLWAVKVLDADGNGSNEKVIRALDWVIAKKLELGGNWIMNFSLGSDVDSFAESEAFRRAADAGLLIVAASGNASTELVPAPVIYPARYQTVVAVGAVDFSRAIATFSNQGPEVDFVAPGVDVLSTVPLGTGQFSFLAAQAATYSANALDGSKAGAVTAEFVFCGLGKPEEIPANVAGKIALIKRGELKFWEKTKNAKERGAVAVAIFNRDDSSTNWTLIPDEDPETKTYDWPVAIALTQKDGEELLAKGSGTITVSTAPDDYGTLNGTSMACPHVAGAVALLWSLAPSATAGDIVGALTATAGDLGATGPDPIFGAGLINVFEAGKRLAPAAFEPIDPMNPPPGSRPSTGRRILKRRG